MALNTTSNQQDGGAEGVPTAGDDGASDIFERLWIEQETGEPATPGTDPDAVEDDEATPQDELEAAEDEETEQEPDDQPETFEVTVEGKTLQVAKDELIRGYQRLSDYTRKTQEVAETRKSLEQRSATVSEAEQHLLALLERYDQQEPEPDWVELQRQDPLGYQEHHARYMQRQKERQAAQAEAQRIRQEQDQRTTAQRREALAREAEALLSKLPEAKGDRKKAQEIVNGALKHGAETYGFTREELQGVSDHRVILALSDAQKWRQLEKAKPTTAAAVTGAPKTVRPGQAGNASAALRDRTTALKTRLAATGDGKDFEALWINAQRAGR